jgi:hypothetical protein
VQPKWFLHADYPSYSLTPHLIVDDGRAILNKNSEQHYRCDYPGLTVGSGGKHEWVLRMEGSNNITIGFMGNQVWDSDGGFNDCFEVDGAVFFNYTQHSVSASHYRGVDIAKDELPTVVRVHLDLDAAEPTMNIELSGCIVRGDGSSPDMCTGLFAGLSISDPIYLGAQTHGSKCKLTLVSYYTDGKGKGHEQEKAQSPEPEPPVKEPKITVSAGIVRKFSDSNPYSKENYGTTTATISNTSKSPIDHIKALEVEALGEVQTGPLPQRLATLEEALLGEAQQGRMADRIETLQKMVTTKTALKPDGAGNNEGESAQPMHAMAVPAPVVMSVTIPSGMQAGQTMALLTPAGMQMQVQIPAGLFPGQQFQVQAPAAAPAVQQMGIMPQPTQQTGTLIENDVSILITMRNALIGLDKLPGWAGLPWNASPMRMRACQGVDADDAGNVTAIELTACCLSGTLPVQVGQLKKLYYFGVSDNMLSGAYVWNLHQNSALTSSLFVQHD